MSVHQDHVPERAVARAELEHRFGFHPADERTGRLHEQVRDACLDAAVLVKTLTPECREQSLAVTKLEEAMMWANAAIARNG